MNEGSLNVQEVVVLQLNSLFDGKQDSMQKFVGKENEKGTKSRAKEGQILCLYKKKSLAVRSQDKEVFLGIPLCLTKTHLPFATLLPLRHSLLPSRVFIVFQVAFLLSTKVLIIRTHYLIIRFNDKTLFLRLIIDN